LLCQVACGDARREQGGEGGPEDGARAAGVTLTHQGAAPARGRSLISTSAAVFCVRSRAVTRGVNKVVKEDLKMALERQVSRCHEHVTTLLRTFLVDEAELLQLNLGAT